jgi:hypothetical protein
MPEDTPEQAEAPEARYKEMGVVPAGREKIQYKEVAAIPKGKTAVIITPKDVGEIPDEVPPPAEK